MLRWTKCENKSVALRLLEETAHYYKTTNCSNFFAIQEAREASILLGFSTLNRQFTKRLKSLDYHPLRGAITNIVEKDIPKKAFKIALLTKKQIVKKFPKITADYLRAEWGGSVNHVSLCFDGKFKEAMEFAKAQKASRDKDLYALEVVSIIALIGIPSLALEMSKTIARKDEVDLVLAIEFFKNNQLLEAKEILEKMKAKPDFYLSEATQIALGITGHVPWQIYPFPDY